MHGRTAEIWPTNHGLMVRIGCQTYTADYWRKKGRRVIEVQMARLNKRFSEADIEQFHFEEDEKKLTAQFLKYLREIRKTNAGMHKYINTIYENLMSTIDFATDLINSVNGPRGKAKKAHA